MTHQTPDDLRIDWSSPELQEEIKDELTYPVCQFRRKDPQLSYIEVLTEQLHKKENKYRERYRSIWQSEQEITELEQTLKVKTGRNMRLEERLGRYDYAREVMEDFIERQFEKETSRDLPRFISISKARAVVSQAVENFINCINDPRPYQYFDTASSSRPPTYPMYRTELVIESSPFPIPKHLPTDEVINYLKKNLRKFEILTISLEPRLRGSSKELEFLNIFIRGARYRLRQLEADIDRENRTTRAFEENLLTGLAYAADHGPRGKIYLNEAIAIARESMNRFWKDVRPNVVEPPE